MKKLKNSKFRNTGFIFEALVRNVTTEALNAKPSISLNMIKKYFKKETELLKEFQLYKMLSEPNKKETISDRLIDAVKENYKKINQQKLKEEKYRLIGELNKKYDIKEFFNTSVEKYRLYGAIYKVLNYNISSNPEEYLVNHQTIKEYITSKPTVKKLVEDEISKELTNKADSMTAFKLIVHKFNKKYSSLTLEQKTILSKFINENTNTESFLRFVQLEANKLKVKLKRVIEVKTKSIDPVQKIKLQELVKLLEGIELTKKVKDEQVDSLIKYHELINLLGK